MPNFKLTIEYDGTSYHGWQRQKNERTIQGEIEKALMTMTKKKVVLTGSGRTDAGVHAFGQVANFSCDTDMLPVSFQKGINSLVEDDIVIKDCVIIDDKFHARYNAKSKRYIYRILNRKIPAAICRQYAWFIPKKLDYKAMASAAGFLIGTHDFKAFEGSGGPRSDTTKHVKRAVLKKKKNGYLIFEIEANGFLRYMVRNIVGTLADVGLGKITPEDFKNILLSKKRSLAGATAPPCGLFLMEVNYDEW